MWQMTLTGACSPNIECFIQILALYQSPSPSRTIRETVFFSGNDASNQGSNLFGGFLDRCVLSPIAEARKETNRAVTGLELTSNITSESISSLPVRVCFCNSK